MENCEVLLASPSLITVFDGPFRLLLIHGELSFTLQATQDMPGLQPMIPVYKWLTNVVVWHCVATGIRDLQLHFWWVWIHFSTNDNNTLQLYIACESENIRSKRSLNLNLNLSAWRNSQESKQNHGTMNAITEGNSLCICIFQEQNTNT